MGSGPEQVADWEQGYNSSGSYGLNWFLFPHPYKYKYKYIWIDLVVIRREEVMPDPLNFGSYVTQFTASTTEGLLLPFELLGENNLGGGTNDFLFSVLSVVPNPFPFEDLCNKNSVQESLKIGEVSYFSLSDSASLSLASDYGGSEADFKLYSGSVSPITYHVVFDPVTPAGNPQLVTSPFTFFESISTTTISPIDQLPTTANVIEGDIRIFVDANTSPMAGTYSSTIYFILTQQ